MNNGGSSEIRERRLLVESVSGTVEVIALSLAAKVGKRWLDDLRSAGHVGAAEAARTYDRDRALAFEGFAWPRIVGAMIDMLRKEGVRLPPALARALEKAAAALGTAFDAYAAEVHENGADDVEDEIDGAAATIAVGLLCLGSGAPDAETSLVRDEGRRCVRQAVSYLAERERVIITLHYFEAQRFKQIAEHVGVEPRTIRKRHRAAMKRLAALLRPLLL